MYCTCTVHIQYMYIYCVCTVMHCTCILHVLYIYCILYMYSTCTLHVLYMYSPLYSTCILHCSTCTLHVLYMYSTCVINVLCYLYNVHSVKFIFHLFAVISLYYQFIYLNVNMYGNSLNHAPLIYRMTPYHYRK